MSIEEMEALLRRSRAPEPPASVERRVLEAARHLRRPAERPFLLFALAAIVVFVPVLFVVLRPWAPEGPSHPGGPQDSVKNWVYTRKEINPDTRQEEVVAVLSADEMTLRDGVASCRALSVRLGKLTIRSDSGRYHDEESRITFAGGIRIDREDGFRAAASAAEIDFTSKTMTHTIDLEARFREHVGKRKPQEWLPKVQISAWSATSADTGTTFVQPTLELKCPTAGLPFAITLSGTDGRTDQTSTTVTGNVRITFEDGRVVEASEAVLRDSLKTLRVKATFK